MRRDCGGWYVVGMDGEHWRDRVGELGRLLSVKVQGPLV